MTKKQAVLYVILPQAVIHQRTGICGECDLPVKRDECVFSNQSDGSDVYSKRPDRALL